MCVDSPDYPCACSTDECIRCLIGDHVAHCDTCSEPIETDTEVCKSPDGHEFCRTCWDESASEEHKENAA